MASSATSCSTSSWPATSPTRCSSSRAPTDTKAQKQFLGYDWSSAKGDEGIKLIKDAHGHHVTPLYDESDWANSDKLNRCVADNFDCRLTAIPAPLRVFASTARQALRRLRDAGLLTQKGRGSATSALPTGKPAVEDSNLSGKPDLVI